VFKGAVIAVRKLEGEVGPSSSATGTIQRLWITLSLKGWASRNQKLSYTASGRRNASLAISSDRRWTGARSNRAEARMRKSI
jgi:hypothetical protein